MTILETILEAKDTTRTCPKCGGPLGIYCWYDVASMIEDGWHLDPRYYCLECNFKDVTRLGRIDHYRWLAECYRLEAERLMKEKTNEV